MRCSSIDLVLGAVAELAARLIAEHGAGLPDPIVAYRDGTRWVQSWEPAPLGEALADELPWRERGVYLITGGLGGLGGVLARYLAESYRARLVLTGRSPLPPREQWDAWLAENDDDEAAGDKIRVLEALDELGAEVVVEQADVADEQAMRRVVAAARERFGRLDGVLHVAGVPGSGGLIQGKRRDEADAVLAPKVAGMRVLEAVLGDEPPDLVLIYSSMGVVLSPLGQADYCAANCALDAFAHRLRQTWPQVRTVAVNWGPWEEVGMTAAADRGAASGPAILARGGMSPDEGVEALGRILSRHRGVQIVTSAIDLTALLAEEKRAVHGLEGPEPGEALERPLHQRPGIATPYVEPRSSLEERMAELWQELLGITPVGIHDDFIELGGHSLVGIQLYSRIQQVFGVTVPLAVLFEKQTIAAMAAVIAEGDEVQPVEAPVVPVPRDRPLPLSFAQERLWFLTQLEPESSAYNIPQAFRFRGPIEVAAIARSLEEIVRRHEVLRTTYGEGPEGAVQIIAPPAPLPLAVVDLTAAGGEEEAIRLLWRESGRPFDLARERVIRACLLRLAPREHLLAVTVHHIVFDVWSQIVLLRELTENYLASTSGRKPRLPALEVQYADFAVWQRERLRDEVLERQIAYWTERLGAQPPAPALSTDRPRPPVESFAGGRLPVAIEPDLAARLETLSRERAATLFMTMVAIFQALLHRLTGQDDLTLGTPVGGRTRPEVQDLIGTFINNLVLRIDLGGDPPFAELLERVREVALEAFAHQELPFEKLVEVLQPERDLSRAPLFQVMFVLKTLPAPIDITAPTGVELTPLAIDPGSAIYDLTLSLDESLSGWMEYNRDLFDASTMARLVGHLQRMAQGAVEDPEKRLSELPLLASCERHQLLAEWNDTGRRSSDACLHELIAAQTQHTPDAVAVTFEGATLSYGELGRQSDRLAGW
ncbi:MAG: SDR family NAD(P)-dependent oxidoreductase, partial [bacterium]|nr:SDR family NAD(P)-dependent oxidoreductase [bacterium]